MRRSIRRLRNIGSERGAALVEFALVVPFLMLMMCATIDFGLVVYTLNNLTAAVREGGRAAAVIPRVPGPGDPTQQAKVKDAVYNYIAGMNSGLNASQVKQLMTVSYDATTGIITVEIKGYPYKPMTPLAPLLGLSTFSLNRKAIFRWEMANS